MGTPLYQPGVGTQAPQTTPEGSYVGGRIDPNVSASVGLHPETLIGRVLDLRRLKRTPAVQTALQYQQSRGRDPGYGPLSGPADPDVLAAGRSAARRRSETGPAGLKWNAQAFVTRMPALIGR